MSSSCQSSLTPLFLEQKGALMFVAQLLSRVWPFATPWTAARQSSLSFTTSLSLLKLMSNESVMTCNQLILWTPFPYPQSFPALGSFPMSQFFTSGGQRLGASASAPVLPMSNQSWFPLGLTGLTSHVYCTATKWIKLIIIGKTQLFS